MMVDHVLQFVIPSAFAILPAPMRSTRASAMLLAIGLQESAFLERHQLNGPARGFWQFELAGVRAVMRHEATKADAEAVIDCLRYSTAAQRRSPSAQAARLHPALADNDTLACCFARLLLWTLPKPLPDREETAAAWDQYLEAWRPGAVKRGSDSERLKLQAAWSHNYAEAWSRVRGQAADES